MENDGNIHERITQLVEEFGSGKNTAFAALIGEKEANIRGYRTSIVPKYHFFEKIVRNLDVNADWLLTGRGEMRNSAEMEKFEIKEKFNLKTDRQLRRQSIPLYPFEATAGMVTVFDDVKPAPVDYLSLPDLPPVDGAVYVRGDSMYPLLKSGDIILYKTVSDFTYGIFWGEMYLVSAVIDGEVYNTVKYVQRGHTEGFIKLVSYNQHHEPKEIPVEMIRAMALVKASVRYNTMG